MDAYLAPVVASLGGGFVAVLVLGAVRLSRLRRPHKDESAVSPAQSSPRTDDSRDDPGLPDLAHRTLGVALLLGLTGIVFFAHTSVGAEGTASAFPVTAAAVTLLAAWIATGGAR